jgi:hypothetical protein
MSKRAQNKAIESRKLAHQPTRNLNTGTNFVISLRFASGC